MMSWIWPLRDSTPMLPDYPGSFGAIRKHVVHTGIDLYCELGQEVVAAEDGEVISVIGFTGKECQDKSFWWNYTDAVIISGNSGYIVYGEVTSRVKVGEFVKAGDIIAIVDTSVLRSFKGRPTVMLHLEILNPEIASVSIPNAVAANRWMESEQQPDLLIDPTMNLIEAAGEDLSFFSLERYLGLKFKDPDAIQKPSDWWKIWGGDWKAKYD